MPACFFIRKENGMISFSERRYRMPYGFLTIVKVVGEDVNQSEPPLLASSPTANMVK
jgi:hypothetical protein